MVISFSALRDSCNAKVLLLLENRTFFCSSVPFAPRNLASAESPRKLFLVLLPLGNTIPGNTKIYCLEYLVSILKAHAWQLLCKCTLSASYSSSRWRCTVKNGVLKIFANFTGKCLCWSLFYKKAAKFSQSCWHQLVQELIKILSLVKHIFLLEKKLNFQGWKNADVLTHKVSNIAVNLSSGTVLLSILGLWNCSLLEKRTSMKNISQWQLLALTIYLWANSYVIIFEHFLVCILKTS